MEEFFRKKLSLDPVKKMANRISVYGKDRLKKKTGEQIKQFLEEAKENLPPFLEEESESQSHGKEELEEESESHGKEELEEESESYGKEEEIVTHVVAEEMVPSATKETLDVISPLKDHNQKKIIKRRKAKKWSEVEEATLRNAVTTHGTGNWTYLLKNYSFPERTAGDLKDKWRNICKKDEKATKC